MVVSDTDRNNKSGLWIIDKKKFKVIAYKEILSSINA